MKLKDEILCDLKRYEDKQTLITLLKCLFKEPGFRFSFFFRIGNKCREKNLKLGEVIIKIIMKSKSINKLSEIRIGTEIGRGLYLGHFSTITINKKAIIGENVNIHKGVTIGQENRGKRKGYPNIGNRVYIGINSTIVGNVKIGDNVLIAPNSYVNFDVPSNSIVIGNPAIVKYSKDATNNYIINCI